jgi:hypothetical protein
MLKVRNHGEILKHAQTKKPSDISVSLDSLHYQNAIKYDPNSGPLA